jgi:hypothetical protein
MEKTNMLFVNQLHSGISNPINNTENIPICLAMSTMKPLKFGLVTPFFKTMAFNFFQSIHWASGSFNYISQIAIDITL